VAGSLIKRRPAFFEIVSLAVLLGMLTLGFFVTAQDFPGPSFCVFKTVFHFDCPGCGLTRCFLLIPRGQISRAFFHNWGGPFLYILFALIFLAMLFRSFGLNHFNAVFWQKLRLSLGTFVIILLLVHWGWVLFNVAIDKS
jgi:hypothetical protein